MLHSMRDSSIRFCDDEMYDRVSSQLSRASSRRAVSLLHSRLTYNDDREALPRVFFCSMIWINQPVFNSEPTTAQSVESDVIKDHKFSVIKHGNDKFQIVQGYIAQSAESSGDGIPTAGFDLKHWQEMKENKYSSSFGFQLSVMNIFLGSMLKYVNNDRFDGCTHKDLFGMEPKGGQEYWPSFSYSELTDNVFIGLGERHMANAIETRLDTWEDREMTVTQSL